MYCLYRKSLNGNKILYQFVEKASLFGCNKGYIPRLLSFQIPTTQGQPFSWHIDIESSLSQREDVNGNALIIDLKPKDTSSVSLYQVVESWGYSDSGWTPIMLHLRGLFVDHDRSDIDDKSFERHIGDIDDPIFSMMYLRGSVEDGKLVGKWTTPGASTTNSVLLWPDSLEYFVAEAQGVLAAVRLSRQVLSTRLWRGEN